MSCVDEDEWRSLFDESDITAAKAMLDKCKQVMTGREIEVCERIASMEEADYESFNLTREDIAWFSNMQVQFAREIAKWTAKEGGAK